MKISSQWAGLIEVLLVLFSKDGLGHVLKSTCLFDVRINEKRNAKTLRGWPQKNQKAQKINN